MLQMPHVLEVVMFPKPNAKKTAFPGDFTFEIPQRDYQTIKLTDNPQEDKTKLALFQSQLRQLLLRKDTLHGLHLLFEDKAKYESYIQALNICHIEKARVYIPQDNHLWLPYVEPPTIREPTLECGTDLLQNDMMVAQTVWNIEGQKGRYEFWQSLAKDFALPLLAYVILLLLTIVGIIKRIKTVANTTY
jgi:hypothetical protein